MLNLTQLSLSNTMTKTSDCVRQKKTTKQTLALMDSTTKVFSDKFL